MHLIPRGKYGFHFAGIHETQNHSVNFMDISFREYYPKGGNIWKIGVKFYLRSKLEYTYLCTSFCKFVRSQWNCVDGTEFYPNRKKNVEH